MCVYNDYLTKKVRVTCRLDHWTLGQFFGPFYQGGRQTISTLIFCHANVKLTPKPGTIIVIENIANSCFQSSTVKSCVCLSSRLVPVPNDTHGLAWIIFQLPHVSLFACDKRSEEKARRFHNMGCNPAVWWNPPDISKLQTIKFLGQNRSQ